jgi:AraC-like DNA-binding protein
MSYDFTRRASPHRWIDSVWRFSFHDNGIYRATPDGCWRLFLLLTPDCDPRVVIVGQRATRVDVPHLAGEQVVAIAFAGHVHFADEAEPPTGAEVRFLPVRGGEFDIKGLMLPLPTFANAEEIVDAMAMNRVLTSNHLVAQALNDRLKDTPQRTLQHHFKRSTGITQKDFRLIRRAQEAVRRLKAGGNGADVAAELGYADQPHMIKSIKRIMGYLPSDLEAVHRI